VVEDLSFRVIGVRPDEHASIVWVHAAARPLKFPFASLVLIEVLQDVAQILRLRECSLKGVVRLSHAMIVSASSRLAQDVTNCNKKEMAIGFLLAIERNTVRTEHASRSGAGSAREISLPRYRVQLHENCLPLTVYRMLRMNHAVDLENDGLLPEPRTSVTSKSGGG
jgi:hypothetical protein